MRVSPATVSDLNKKEIYRTIETRRNRPIEGEHEVRSLLKPVPGAAQPKPNVRKILDIRSFAVHLHTAPYRLTYLYEIPLFPKGLVCPTAV
jgi:hypothetical protein